MRWILSILLNGLVLIVVAGLMKILVPDSFYIANIGTAIVASVILSLLNVFVKPLLILVTLPITVVTFGFFLVVINAITLKMADAILGSSFDIQGFGAAVAAAIGISVFNMLIDRAILRPLSERKE
ncbi:phage holin family protein [Ectobacillus ponti]|uniref:Phage holin family protein n=1 Tax=Ectobacillus ponti TaxID=2961894 RepID=A0AA41X8C9_9BACI|nr:phage holin family protein [Ectobacillus ponti]MCP8970612.1 phage holin family protein [Ectobacillus ponti]